MRIIGLIPLLPLLGAVALLLTGTRWKGTSSGWLASALVFGSFVTGTIVLSGLLGEPASARVEIARFWEWIAVGAFHVPVELRADPLSIVMVLTVTGVATIIHVYAIDYMHGDPRYSTFFAYLNLFVFFMLVLVLANNFLVLYLGWEGVGLCSYLLIGFWFERPAAAFAAKKAFIVTRIGDSAFLIGIVLIWLHFHTLSFDPVFRGAHGLANGTATVIALLLFSGAIGKSAQMPLHVWLPDAMEGPTPVSALIHAATMVTAGVYLVVRTHALFEASGIALTIVAFVGLVTAIYSGLSAIGQDDIKRMLAYSTISQLGFMFFGAGMGAYAGAIFLLVAHAFFKALLFLAAGSVMHGLPDDETDMIRMGALRKVMPVTAYTWMVGWLAMAGIPPLSGFFAKDQVVAAAQTSGRTGLWIAVLFAAVLTALYETRATFIAFFGDARYEGHPHDPPARMRLAMILLGIGAVAGGVLGLTESSGLLGRFLDPVVGIPHRASGALPTVALSAIAVAVALVGILIAWFVYLSGRIDWQGLRARFPAQKRTLAHGFYVNDVYDAVLVANGQLLSAFTAYVIDLRIVDGTVNGVGWVVRTVAATGRRVQTGFVRSYALAFLVGVVGILLWFAVRY